MNGGMVVGRLNAYLMICGIAAAATLAGCASPAERQAAKQALAAKRAAPTAVVMKSQSGDPLNDNSTQHYKDGYPSFNGPLTAANVQLNDQQATTLQNQLTALGAKRDSGAISQAEYDKRVAEMRKLAADHGQDTLSQIDN